ncbi:hypothetical protein BH10ACT11_BH10ACT11_12280 [soil metagenome]
MKRGSTVRPGRPLTVALAAAAVAIGGCGGGQSQGAADQASAAANGLPQGAEQVKVDPSQFTTKIDNPYLSFSPGDRWVYRGSSDDGPDQRIVVTVTDRTKTVANGVKGVVVHDVATVKGRTIENTYDWYAQDAQGNVWYEGEDTKAYDGSGKPDTAGSFEAGVDGAEAGVAMPGSPTQGQTYRQEYYPGQARDGAEVLGTAQKADAPAGHYEDVVITGETTPLEPKIEELKFYARGVGNVRAISVSGESDREDLTSFRPGGG